MTHQDPTPPRGTPRILLTVEEAADTIGIGRTTTFALVKSGELKSVKVGRLRRVPLAEVNAYTEQLMAEQDTTDTTEGN
ncbi:MAG TPA: helix-turn-helix domain-containing protein [Actinocrinis sp.]|nr:helix-turn-helix domain-containing protein [Actinocrinis sp.]